MKAAYYSRANSYSKSYNAQIAEREGRYPATQFKKVYGIDPRTVTTATEWHHVGKFAKRVDYYSLQDVLQSLADMQYAERTRLLTRRFKPYWQAARGELLGDKLGNRHIPPAILEFKIWNFGGGRLALQINDSGVWGRAFRKALADGRHFFGCEVRLSNSGSDNFFHINKIF